MILFYQMKCSRWYPQCLIIDNDVFDVEVVTSSKSNRYAAIDEILIVQATFTLKDEVCNGNLLVFPISSNRVVLVIENWREPVGVTPRKRRGRRTRSVSGM